MSFSFSPKIVTDGLVLYLDAANTRSYAGSGTMWNDLSKGENSGTLTNGPIFNSDKGGFLSFDGIDDYMVINDNDFFTLSNVDFSFDFWINFSTVSNNRTIVSQYNAAGIAPIWIGRIGGNVTVFSSSDGVNWNILNNALSFSVTTDTWYNITITRSGNTWASYKNGVQQSTITAAGVLYNSTNNFIMAYRNVVGDGYHACKISNFKLYKNKSLTASEVLQNYNTTKGRFL